MNPVWIWLAAIAAYGVFSLWYNNWRGPLTPEEIEHYAKRLEGRAEGGIDPERFAAVRKFLEADDGREFFMVNLVRLNPGEVAVPGSDEKLPAPEVLRKYTGYFMPALFRKAGHPAFFARAAGGYVESWGVEPDPGWSFAGMVRYRSRRDMMDLATNPDFDPAHVYKIAAMASTFAFPASPGMVFFGPRVWVGLALGLVAALGQLFFGTRS